MARHHKRRDPAGRRFARLGLEALEPRTLLAAFTPGNLVVNRLGDGGGIIQGASQPVALVELTTAGVDIGNVVAIPVPTAHNSGGLADVSSLRNGQLNRSADGRYLTLMGYDAAIGTAMTNGTTSANV